MKRNKDFISVELMVVTPILGVLAAMVAPIACGRTNTAKWAEANATGGG